MKQPIASVKRVALNHSTGRRAIPMAIHEGPYHRFINPLAILSHIWQYRDLIRQRTAETCPNQIRHHDEKSDQGRKEEKTTLFKHLLQVRMLACNHDDITLPSFIPRLPLNTSAVPPFIKCTGVMGVSG